MSVDIDPELVEKLASQIKTQDDLAELSRQLLKVSVERVMAAELEDHLGYSKHAPEGQNSGNSRNGYSKKTLKGDFGEVEVKTPRDRNGEFSPQLIAKGKTRINKLDQQILALYSRGMTTRDIADALEEMYGADVSHNLISKVTEAVQEEVQNWQNRPLESLYPIVYLDGIVVKVHQDKRVVRKTVYVALGVDIEGQKELLGLWIAETEGAKFWLSVLTELQSRGLEDIFIACVDGLSGFPEAINTVYPKAQIQLCIVHQVRNSLKYVSYKDRKAVSTDLKKIYQSATVDEAERELSAFEVTWDDKFPSIGKSWRNNWDNLITLFDYPDDIRKAIYTTNAIESLNSVIRKAIKQRKIFPSDNSVMKVIYLAMERASAKWTMPIRNWVSALNRFAIMFPDRFRQ
ncbi:IS256 family transposase [Endozoicomonas lisbonensis]|uniref:Mutator family transposase n=1 Tax=Endozoicomonas lisbonensis TaxID=3120522 RepID=A0ABV2SER4_9GAMM